MNAISSSSRGQSGGEAPVFNCIVHVTAAGAEGLVTARVANLAGISAQGKSEREALAQVVAAFKAAVASYHTQGQQIPFVLPPPPGLGTVERLIAVHL